MGLIRRTWNIWRTSSHVASQQIELDKCPCCFAAGPEFLFNANDLSAHVFVDRRLKRGRYSLCRTCGTIFAARRPSPETAETYYELFPELEEKTHNIYPPPTRNSKGKIARAKEILALLEKRGLLKLDMAVLHIRSDVGALLKALRNRLPSATLHGLDYFANNVRYLREEGFAEIARLSAAAIELPFNTSYDLILANHIFTHALDPRGDLARLRNALNSDGHILFYSEVDHSVLFDPASALFSRIDVINYHKQLFVPETFDALLRNGGFRPEFLGRNRFTMTYLGTPSDEIPPAPQVASEFLDRERRMIVAWQKTAKRYRYPIAVVEAMQPLLQWRRARKSRQRLAS
jgi:methyltransferase family protein